MSAVEGGAGVGGDIDRTQRVSAGGIERLQRVSGGNPDVLTVERDPVDAVDTWKGSIFPEDFGGGSFHVLLPEHESRKADGGSTAGSRSMTKLVARQWTWE